MFVFNRKIEEIGINKPDLSFLYVLKISQIALARAIRIAKSSKIPCNIGGCKKHMYQMIKIAAIAISRGNFHFF